LSPLSGAEPEPEIEEVSDSDSNAYESANELDVEQWDALEAIENERTRRDIYSYSVFARR